MMTRTGGTGSDADGLYTHIDGTPGGEVAIVEPLIHGADVKFVKWNSNSGWVNNDYDEADDFMQGLSHFSYECTEGAMLLCDLQGGILEHA